jgi:hypothetical protein
VDAPGINRPASGCRGYRRRLVAGARGRPRAGHTRPLGATAQAEARPSLGNPRSRVDRGGNRQPRLLQPRPSAAHHRRAPGGDPRHAAPRSTGDPHFRPGGRTRSDRPAPGAAGPRPLPGPVRGGTRRYHAHARHRGSGRRHGRSRGEEGRRPGCRQPPQPVRPPDPGIHG